MRLGNCYVEQVLYMSLKLFFQAIIKFLLGIILVGFLIFLLYPFIISKRIKSEENLLKKELAGYEDYTQRVKYRLIPYIW